MEGRLQTRKWQDKQGLDRYTTEIVANNMQMLGGGNGGGQEAPTSAGKDGQSQVPASAPAGVGDFDDAILY